MITITFQDTQIQVREGTRVKELFDPSDYDVQICGAYVDFVVKSLEYTLNDGETVILISLADEPGMRIYMSTLQMLFSKSCYMVFPDKEFSISYSLGGGVFCEYKDRTTMTPNDIESIKKQMRKLVEEQYRIMKHKIPWKEAYTFMRRHEHSSATQSDLMTYVHARKTTLYEIDDFYGYYYSKLLTNTKDAPIFNLVPYEPGCVIMGPDPKNLTKVRAFESQPKLHKEFQAYEKWCERLDVMDVVALNRKIENGRIKDLVTVAEARHEQLISDIADDIYLHHEQKRVILIAGPSSAGKTTTSKRLRAHLVAKGLYPIAIGLDDYFVDRTLTPKDENGNYDFETINAIDIELFNKHLLQLMEGKDVEVPIFDFITGSRKPHGKVMQVEQGSPIIIEGIHGLNEILTNHIPRNQKYKIYINDLTHLNIDQNNHIPTSDVRLLRRIVRDVRKRGHNAEATISMWQSVKRGEEKNIYPYSSEADFVFNSSLFYEMSVLKKYAEPALYQVPRDSAYFAEAWRLLSFLSFFLELSDERAIYADSILREFIGGSIFDDL